jgi:hypothetical protein
LQLLLKLSNGFFLLAEAFSGVLGKRRKLLLKKLG